MELAIVARHALAVLRGRGLRVERAWMGDFLTALEMPGCSLSILKVDRARLALLDAPADSSAWRAGSRTRADAQGRAGRDPSGFAREAGRPPRPAPARRGARRRLCPGGGRAASHRSRQQGGRRRSRPQHDARRRSHSGPGRGRLGRSADGAQPDRRCAAPGDRRQFRPVLCDGPDACGASLARDADAGRLGEELSGRRRSARRTGRRQAGRLHHARRLAACGRCLRGAAGAWRGGRGGAAGGGRRCRSRCGSDRGDAAAPWPRELSRRPSDRHQDGGATAVAIWLRASAVHLTD